METNRREHAPIQSTEKQSYVSKDAIGEIHEIREGECGVTHEWIQRLIQMDRQDRDSNRKYYSKSDGKHFMRVVYSLDEISKDELDRCECLVDESSDIEMVFYSREERIERNERIRKAFYLLNSDQRFIAWAIYVKGMTQKRIAELMKIDPTSVRDRLKVIKKKLLKNY